MTFDFDGAEATGASKQDILSSIEKSGNTSYDFAGARKAGYSTDAIYEHVKTKLQATPAYNPENIVPGPPEEDQANIVAGPPEGQVNIGDITAEALPDNTSTARVFNQDGTSQVVPSTPKNTYTSGEEIVGAGEAALTLATGATSGLVGGIVGGGAAVTEQMKRKLTGDKPMTDAEFEAYAQEPAQALTYAPKTEAGQKDVAAVGEELAVFGYMSPLLVETAGLSTMAKVQKQLWHSPMADIEASKLISDVDEALRASHLKDLAGENKFGGGLSKEARLLVARHVNNPEITTGIIATVLDGIPKEDQAYILTRFLGDANLIKQAVRGEGDKLAANLKADLIRGKAKITGAIGNPDLPAAKAQWKDTEEYLRKPENSVVRDATVINEAANNIIAKFRPPEGTTGEVQAISDKGYSTAIQIRNLIASTGGKLNIAQAFEVRPELNGLIRKATGLERSNLITIQKGLDEFIAKMSTPEQKTRIAKTLSAYHQATQNTEALEIIRKNTDSGGIAVNWKKVHKELEASGLRTPETVQAIRIAEAFSAKFGNDQKLLPAATTQGSNYDAGGVLGITGEVANFFKNHFAMWGNRAENIKIQNAILKSIKYSKTNYDFVDSIKANKNIPEAFKTGLDEVLQIAYNPAAKQTGDVNLNPLVTPVGGTEAKVAAEAIPPESQTPSVPPEGPPPPSVPPEGPPKGPPPEGPTPNVPPTSSEEFNSIAKALANDPRYPTVKSLEAHMASIKNLKPTRNNLDEIEALKEAIKIKQTYKPSVPPEGPTPSVPPEGPTPSVPPEGPTPSVPTEGPTPSSEEFNSIAKALANDPRYPTVKSLEAHMASIKNLKPTRNNLDEIEALKEAIKIKQTYKPSVPPTSAQAIFDTIATNVRRLERVTVANRTPEQVAQLTAMRAERLKARRAIETAQNNVTNNVTKIDKFYQSFNASGHDISIRQNPDYSNTDYKILTFNDTAINVEVDGNKVHINTLGFKQGSSEGTKFYTEFYKALDASGLVHYIGELTNINIMRLPINIYKHKLATGNLPIDGGQVKLNGLMKQAIETINEKASGSRTASIERDAIIDGWRRGDGKFDLNGNPRTQEGFLAMAMARLDRFNNKVRRLKNEGADSREIEEAKLRRSYAIEEVARIRSGKPAMAIQPSAKVHIKNLNDSQLEELAKITGPMPDIHAGINSLKLYRKAARLLANGQALSVVALAPFIAKAYSEIEKDGSNTQ